MARFITYRALLFRAFSIFYEDSDLDLYVSSSHVREVVTLLRTQYYEYIPEVRAGVSRDLEDLLTDIEKSGFNDRDHPVRSYGGWGSDSSYRKSSIRAVLGFRHRGNAARVVQIIAVYDSLPPISSIMWFHSSASEISCRRRPPVIRLYVPPAVVLNYITWNKAVSLYPFATFEERRSLILSENRSFGLAQDKYLARGFTFQSVLTPNEARSPGPFKTGPRYVGDEKTWILDLETESIPFGSISTSRREYDPEMIHSWDLTDTQYPLSLSDTPPTNVFHGPTWRRRNVPFLYFSFLEDESLKHKYVVHREFHRIATEMCLREAAAPSTDPAPSEDVDMYVLRHSPVSCSTSTDGIQAQARWKSHRMSSIICRVGERGSVKDDYLR